MTTFMAHPHRGLFLLTRHHVGIVRITQTLMQTRGEHCIRCCKVRNVATRLRSQVIIHIQIRTRRRCRVRVRLWIRVWLRIRHRVWLRLQFRRITAAGQIPVTTICPLSTRESVVIRPRNDTTSLNKFALRLTVYMDKFDTVKGFRTCTASVIHRNGSRAASIALDNQFIGY